VSSGNGAVAVPNVAGRSEADARNALNQAGFTNIQKQEQASDSVAAGNVISTDPAAGAQVDPTEPIVLVVSSGASKVAVPSVQNLSEANARAALEGVGLVASVQTQNVLNPTQDGIVITQSPSAGAMVDKGSSVTIFVGDFAGSPTTENPP
jgi:eukaryotic-like serine/threonine-protein kinase